MSTDNPIFKEHTSTDSNTYHYFYDDEPTSPAAKKYKSKSGAEKDCEELLKKHKIKSEPKISGSKKFYNIIKS